MAYTSLADIPTKERAELDDVRNRWEGLAGYAVDVPDWMLVEMANSPTGYESGAASPISVKISGPITSLSQFGRYMLAHVNTQGDSFGALVIGKDLHNSMPWAFYGITQDEYQSQATTFGSEYKKVTGEDIPPDQLAKAFEETKDATGGLLSGSEYLTRLQQDANIQKTYGWVKFGMDFNSFQQQKLSMRQSFGRDLTNEEAVTQLTYLHAAQGGDHEARGHTAKENPQAAIGPSGSVTR